MTTNAPRRMLRDRLRGDRAGAGPQRLGANIWVRIATGIFGAGMIGFALAGGVGYCTYLSYANGLEPPDEVIAKQPSGGAQIFDRQGNLLYEYVDDRSGLRSPVKLDDISPWLIAATVSTEDASFWNNPGVNIKGLARAALETVHVREAKSENTTGGSSITQQLVKNVYISQEDRQKRSVRRKFKESVYALELTNRYSKDQILEWYLNQIPYGGLYNGVEAASEGYFGKHAKDLTLEEAAMLAGIPACPSCYEPIANPEAAIQRRNEVLQLMHKRDNVEIDIDGVKTPATRFQVREDGTKVEATDAMFYVSTLAPPNITKQRFPVKAPHWVFDYIERQLVERYGKEALYRGGLRVTTTLDLALQGKAQAALEHWISEFEGTAQGHNGSLVAIDPKTSEILVMVGSRDYFRDDIQGRNNNATALNSPGSTLKPFAYAAAFEQLGWGPGTELLDSPISFQDGDRLFTPRNPVGDFHGPISVRNALGNSLNIPAFKTALYVGVPNIVSEFKKFGMTSLDEGTFGPSVTIGGVDVKLMDVTYGYSVFAANGVMRGIPTSESFAAGNRKLDPVSILQITRADGSVLYPTTEDHRVKVQEERVVDPEYAYMVNNILSDPNAFCITYGCGALSIGRPWGVKTGTSEPYENSRAIGETWTYGYTPDLVAGVWAGNSDNTPMYNITSTSISYRALRDFMLDALANTPASEFERPDGITEVDTCTPSGLKAGPSCGRKAKNMLPKDKPSKDDDWWRSVKVDVRDGLLATELTPSQFVAERRALVIPDSVQGFARSQAEEWARVLGIPTSAPTERSSGRAPVRLDQPDDGSHVRGVVTVTGLADSPDFVSYRLEYGAGDDPARWTLITQSDQRKTGELGQWNTDALQSGKYTLRLVLQDAKHGEFSTFVTVTVDSDVGATPSPLAPETPGPSPTPKPGNGPPGR